MTAANDESFALRLENTIIVSPHKEGPSPALLKALAVIDQFLHPTFDAQFRMPKGKSKESCVLVALTIRDFLVAIDLPASVRSVGCVMWATRRGKRVHSLGTGVPQDDAILPGRFNGHLVAQYGGWLIDGVVYAARRPAWPELAGIVVVAAERPTGSPPIVMEREVIAGLAAVDGKNIFNMLYVDRPENIGWLEGPDASRPDMVSMRDDVVRALVREWERPGP
jgi:hypothetical protein